MRRRLRVASFNVHAGIDGFGRPTSAVDAAVAIDADVLFVQEAWRSGKGDLAAQVAAATGAVAHVYELSAGFLRHGEDPSTRWQPRGALLNGRHGIVLDAVRPVPEAHRRRLSSSPRFEYGEWCMGLVTRLEVLDLEVLELTHLAKDRARRRLVCATLDADGQALRCFGLHGAHLSHGSLGQYRELVVDLAARLDEATPAVLGGDLNCWGFVARRVLRGWRQAVRGPTWPAWRPHSQLDHLFVRGPVDVVDGRVLDVRESDHRPVVATIELHGR